MKVIEFFRIGLDQRARQKVRLFLVISLKDDPICRSDQGFQRLHELVLPQYRIGHPWGNDLHAPFLFVAPRRP
jgi:hypothetical protein